MTRRPFGSIQLVTVEVTVPFIARLWSSPAGMLGVDDAGAPSITLDMSIVRSIVPLVFVSTTAALMPLRDSSRKYLLFVVTWIPPVPRVFAWSNSLDHVSLGWTGLSGRTAKMNPPRPLKRVRGLSPKLLPFTASTRPSAATVIEIVGNVVVVVALISSPVDVFITTLVRSMDRPAFPVASTDLTVTVSTAVSSSLIGTFITLASIVSLAVEWSAYLYVSPLLYVSARVWACAVGRPQAMAKTATRASFFMGRS